MATRMLDPQPQFPASKLSHCLALPGRLLPRQFPTAGLLQELGPLLRGVKPPAAQQLHHLPFVHTHFVDHAFSFLLPVSAGNRENLQIYHDQIHKEVQLSVLAPLFFMVDPAGIEPAEALPSPLPTRIHVTPVLPGAGSRRKEKERNLLSQVESGAGVEPAASHVLWVFFPTITSRPYAAT